MDSLLIVRGAPEEYICKKGSWHYLESFLHKRHDKRVFVLHGEKSWAVAKNFFPSFESVDVHYEHYKNQCSFSNAKYFEKKVKDLQIDCIIAVGGGKLLDLGKLVANNCLIDIICLPTLASTCASYTPISIVYNESGELVEMKFLNQSVSLTLIDPEVILDSPVDYLIAGIGDTLAKWYESEPIISTIKTPTVEINVSQFAAKACQDNLLAFGKQAITDLENKKLTPAFIRVVETTILLAGMVGGFGDKYGRSSGAHAIHDAMSYVKATHKHLHGNKVAYGILVQLAVEEKWEEIKELLEFYRKLQLPTKLAHLDLGEEDIKLIASVAAKDELFQQLPKMISESTIEQAILALE